MSEPARPERLPLPIRLALRLAAVAPLPAGYWLAAALGEVACWLAPDRGQSTVASMAVVLAQSPAHPAARRLAQASYRGEAMARLDGLRLPSLPPAMLERGLLSQGWEHLDSALAQGRGAIVVAATVGNWTLIPAVLARRGYRVAARATETAALDALACNEVVVLIVDGPPPAGGVPVRLFGQPTRLPSGPARLAWRSGAPLLHGWLLRRVDLISFQGGLEPVPAPRPTGEPTTDEQALTQALAGRLERLIQAHPEQWTIHRPPWPNLLTSPTDPPSA